MSGLKRYNGSGNTAVIFYTQAISRCLIQSEVTEMIVAALDDRD